MTLNLVKLCVGAASVEELAQWQKGRISARRKARRSPHPYHTTFQTPKRQAELLDGGSLYWVIKGVIQARQRLVAIEEGTKEDGTACCVLVLEEEIVPVRPTPRRAFQGWRYLSQEDAPLDLKGSRGRGIDAMPPAMRRELAALGLI